MNDGTVRRITWRTADVVRVLSLGAVFFFLWKFFWLVYTALFIGLIALLLAIVIHAPARLLSRWVPFRLGFAVSVLVLLGAATGLMIALIPQVIEQFAQLAAQLPAALTQVQAWVESHTGELSRNPELLNEINQQLFEFVGRFVPLASNLVSVLFGAFAVVILAIFLAAQPDTYRDLLIRIVPPGNRARAAQVYEDAGRSLRNWVLGKAFTMVLVGIFVWMGLTLFGIPGALALAALAAILEFIPNFGPTIAAAPAVIAAFAISPATALYVAVFYFALQQVQSAITVPLVERRAVDIPPAALLIWQLMLAVGFGILGLFVATPLLAVLVVAVRVMYVEPAESRQVWDRRESAQPVAGEP